MAPYSHFLYEPYKTNDDPRNVMDSKRQFQINRQKIFGLVASKTKQKRLSMFLYSYLFLVDAALRNDDSPQNEFFNTVVPYLKQKDGRLELYIESIQQITQNLLHLVGLEHEDWYRHCCADYVIKLRQAWIK